LKHGGTEEAEESGKIARNAKIAKDRRRLKGKLRINTDDTDLNEE